MKQYKSITRYDYNACHGWWVRVAWKRKMRTKMFSDRVHGGKRKALAAAIAWRNETEEALGKPRSERTVVYSDNPLVGITEGEKVGRTRDGNEWSYPVFFVSCCDRRTTVSITKYGRKKALELAKQKRKAWEAELLR